MIYRLFILWMMGACYCSTLLHSVYGQDFEREVQELTAELPTASEQRFREILLRFCEIGPEARAAVPIIFNVSESENDFAFFSSYSDSTLSQMGGEIIPELRQRLAENPSQVLRVIDQMMTEDAAPLVPDMISLLDHPDQEIRYRVAKLLGRFAADSELAVPALVELFERQRDDDDLVYSAVSSLGVSCPQTKVALPELLHLSKETSHNHIRDAIVLVAASIDPESEECLQILVDGLDNDQALGPWGSVRGNALEVLASIGPHAKPAQARLLKILEADTATHHHAHYLEICTILANVGAQESLAILRKHLSQLDDPELIVGTATAIARLDPEDEQSIDQLIEILNRRSPQPHLSGGKLPRQLLAEEQAAHGLGLIGERASKAIPALERAMESERYTLSRKAAWAIARIDPQNQACVNVLRDSNYSCYPGWEFPLYRESPEDVVRILGDRIEVLVPSFIEASFAYEADRGYMVEIIAQLENQIPHFVERAMELIDDSGDEISRDNVYESMSALGVRAAPALDMLLAYVEAESHYQRAEAARILGVIRQNPRKVIPKLVALLDDPRVLVRARAATALGKFRSEAESTLFQLREATQDKYYFVRHAAEVALQTLAQDE